MNRAEKVAFARRAAADGIVLLKNEGNALPLAAGSEVVLMGVTSYICHRMGWGSGDMLAQHTVQYDRGLADAGIRLFQPVADFYRRALLDKKLFPEFMNRYWWQWTKRYPEPSTTREGFAAMVKGHRKLPCIVTIGRGSGESLDIAPGREGWQLFWEEEFLLELATANFDNVIVLLNVPGPIDTSWLDKFPVKAVVLTGMLGETSGHAVADVLTGRVNPAAKLTATWARRLRDYPTTDLFAANEVPFREGIYVGYRYFDTFDVEPRFPFGYGLSYTKFDVDAAAPVVKGSRVTLSATVKNTGKRAGACVVQCYLSQPDDDEEGERDKAYQDLASFGKTAVLEPGASAKVDLSFDLTSLASYSESRAAYVLDPGDYVLYVGTSSCETAPVAVMSLDKLVVVASTKHRFQTDFSDMRLLRKPEEACGSLVETAEKVARIPLKAASFPKTVKLGTAGEAPAKALKAKKAKATFADVVAGRATLEDVVARFSNHELASMVNGVLFADFPKANQVEGGTGVGGFDGVVRGEAAEFWHSDAYKIPPCLCADGPSGVRLTIFGDEPAKDTEMAGTMVAYPSGSCLAQSWDLAAAEKLGRCASDDMGLAGIDGWLAPGMNIQRNPLCGRNFEYFSEDPLVAGKMAAAVVRGVQTTEAGKPSGFYATVKHFAVNSQEYQRNEQNNIVTERALREIYLRGFGIAVREGKPLALMTSYNKVNGEYSATNKDLLDGVLRSEWGFEGMVMTDWWNNADNLRHQLAGNDVIMPGVAAKRDLIEKALDEKKLDRAAIQRAAVRVLRLVLQTRRA